MVKFSPSQLHFSYAPLSHTASVLAKCYLSTNSVHHHSTSHTIITHCLSTSQVLPHYYLSTNSVHYHSTSQTTLLWSIMSSILPTHCLLVLPPPPSLVFRHRSVMFSVLFTQCVLVLPPQPSLVFWQPFWSVMSSILPTHCLQCDSRIILFTIWVLTHSQVRFPGTNP